MDISKAEYGNLIHLLWQNKVNSRKRPGFLEYWKSTFVSRGENSEVEGQTEMGANKTDGVF